MMSRGNKLRRENVGEQKSIFRSKFAPEFFANANNFCFRRR